MRIVTRALTTGALAIAVLTGGTSDGTATRHQDAPLDLSCATFPPDTSAADLVERFGRAHVTAAPVTGSDDSPEDGTVIFPDSDDTRLEIAWYDSPRKRRPRWIRARGEHSRWRPANGIALGTDLRTLERANGRPFRLAGFSTELQGAVTSWAEGRLAADATDGCTVRVVLQPRDEAEFELERQVRFAREVSSGHPAMQALNPHVVAVVITYAARWQRRSARIDSPSRSGARTQFATVRDAQATAADERGHRPRDAAQRAQQGRRLRHAQHEGQARPASTRRSRGPLEMTSARSLRQRELVTRRAGGRLCGFSLAR